MLQPIQFINVFNAYILFSGLYNKSACLQVSTRGQGQRSININVFTVILTTALFKIHVLRTTILDFVHIFYILVYYTFFIGLYLFNTATDRVYFWHTCTLGPGLYSPNVFGDAALINYANLCKFSQNHLKCSYFLISRQILFKFGIKKKVLMFLVMLPSLIMLIYANLVKITLTLSLPSSPICTDVEIQ